MRRDARNPLGWDRPTDDVEEYANSVLDPDAPFADQLGQGSRNAPLERHHYERMTR